MSNKLFIKAELPLCRKTFTLRSLSRVVSVSDIRGQIELHSGIVFSLNHSLYLGELLVDNREDFRFGKNINSGSVLVIRPYDLDPRVHGVMQAEDVQGTEEDEKEREEEMFNVMFLHCYEGNATALRNHLKHLDAARGDSDEMTPIRSPLTSRTTSLTGRTLIHAAAANDQTTTLQILIEISSDEDSESLWTQDRYNQTALDIAKRKHCKLAERLLIYATLRRKCPIPLSAKTKTKSAIVRASTAIVTGKPLRASTAIPRLRDPSSAKNKTTIYDDYESDIVGDPGLHITPTNTERTQIMVHSKCPNVATWSDNNRKWPPDVRNPSCLAIGTPSRDKVYVTAKNAREMVTPAMTFVRQKSAYYRGKCHNEFDAERDCIGEMIEDSYKRPETATSRYRPWKTWLQTQEHQTFEAKQKIQERDLKREANSKAFKSWCKNKIKQKEQMEMEQCEEDSGNLVKQKRLNVEAYHNWISKKTQIFSRRVDEPKMKCKEVRYDPHLNGERKLPGRPFDTNQYMKAYRLWQEKDVQHAYSSPYEDPVPVTRDQIENIRRSLVMEGMTYGDWCSQKRREDELGDKQIYLPTPRREREVAKETACFSVIVD